MALAFPSLSSPWDGSAHIPAYPSLLGITSENTFGCTSWVTLKSHQVAIKSHHHVNCQVVIETCSMTAAEMTRRFWGGGGGDREAAVKVKLACLVGRL